MDFVSELYALFHQDDFFVACQTRPACLSWLTQLEHYRQANPASALPLWSFDGELWRHCKSALFQADEKFIPTGFASRLRWNYGKR